MKISKQFLSTLLAIIMFIGIAPSGFFAPEKAEAANLGVGATYIAKNGDGTDTLPYTVTDSLTSPTSPVTISQNNKVYEITGNITSSDSSFGIVVNSGYSTVIILNGVTATGSTAALRILGTGTATVILVDGTVNTFTCSGTSGGSTAVQAGIVVQQNATLIIKGQAGNSGYLEANGGAYSAGLGNGPNQTAGNITIEGGHIVANSRALNTSNGTGNGAGIGGGGGYTAAAGAGANLTICGNAYVVATAASDGAGIGGAGGGAGTGGASWGGAGGTVNIYGNATVIATSLGNGAGIGGGSTISGTNAGASGDITISGNVTVVAKSQGSAASYDIGPGVRSSNNAAGNMGNITITSGNVRAVNGKTGTVKNGIANGDKVVYMYEVTDKGTLGIPKLLAYAVDKPVGYYTYIATTNSSNKAYVWLPDGGANFADISKTTSKVYLTDGNTDKVAITVDALRGHITGEIAGIQWFRVPTTDGTTYGDSNFNDKYLSASGAGNAGSNPAATTDLNETYYIEADRNGKYWVKIDFEDNLGVITSLYKEIIVDNFFKPVEMYVQDVDIFGVVIKPYTKLRSSGDLIYGIPFDLDGSVIDVPSAGLDTVLYIRNPIKPDSHWAFTLPVPAVIGNPFSSIELSSIVAQDLVEIPNEIATIHYTALYDRNENWCTVTATFVDAAGAPLQVDGKSDEQIWVPLDPPLYEEATDFMLNGGVYKPAKDSISEARGWYFAAAPHIVGDISMDASDPNWYYRQNYFTLFDPDFNFTSIIDSGINKEGVLPDGKNLYIVYSTPAVRLVENHYLVGTTTEVHEQTDTIIESSDLFYKKQSLTTLVDRVCVGYEVINSDGSGTVRKSYTFDLPLTDPPNKSQLGLVHAEILAADSIDFYNEKPIINFYYEPSIDGIPVSEAVVLTTRWRGEICDVYVSARNAEYTTTRINRLITKTNDGSLAGNEDDSFAGEVSTNRWFFDKEKPGNLQLQSVFPTSTTESPEIIFFYSFSTRGIYMDKKQYIVEQYRDLNGDIIGDGDTETMIFVQEQYTKAAPPIPGYLAVSVWSGEYLNGGTLISSEPYVSFERALSPPNEIITFVYMPVAMLRVKWRSAAGSSVDAIFDEEVRIGSPGDSKMEVDPGYTNWVLDRVELNGVVKESPYIVTLTSVEQELVFYYNDLYSYTTITINGQARLGGKQRTDLSAFGYTVRSELDAGIKIELVNLDNNEVLSKSYSFAAALGSQNFKLPIDLDTLVSMDLINGNYVLRFSRVGNNPTSDSTNNNRNESYLYAEILMDFSKMDMTPAALNLITDGKAAVITNTIVLVPGSFVMNSAEKNNIIAADVTTLKAFIGISDTSMDTTVYNINEYLGVDAADYATVLNSMTLGSSKNIGKLTIKNSNIGSTVSLD